MTDTTADMFFGVGLQCARCHDHKFDPILQRDYYRLQAFFTPMWPRTDLTFATDPQRAAYAEASKEWLEKTATIRADIACWMVCVRVVEPHPESDTPGRLRSADVSV